MAESRSNKSGFESRYGGEWISRGQWLAEIACERTARKDGQNLPFKFWTNPKWAKIFKAQITHANRLLKKYDVSAITKALRTSRGKRAYSLGAKFLVPLIEDEQRKLSRHQPPEPVAAIPDTTEAPRPTFAPTPSLLNSLRNLDNGQKEEGSPSSRDE